MTGLLAAAGGAATAIAVAGVAIAHYAAWRSVALMPIESPGRTAAVLVGGLLLLGGAGGLGLRPRPAARVAAGAACGLALIVGCAGGVSASAAQAGGAGQSSLPRDVVATSEDGRFEVVSVRPSADEVRYRLRTRGRWSGREGKLDFACTPSAKTRPDYDLRNSDSELPRSVPTVRLEAIRLTGEPRVELRMSDATSWTVGFDVATLRPDRVLSWCGPEYGPPR
ncbi:hypothetical protein [Dactylosporangium sp. CS-033363]|uniref:hypothetical protein n=1 Tax=Dactylosporangium sp. CS-033363 TaxID=3239935 RepID=UPI003D8C993F